MEFVNKGIYLNSYNIFQFLPNLDFGNPMELFVGFNLFENALVYENNKFRYFHSPTLFRNKSRAHDVICTM